MVFIEPLEERRLLSASIASIANLSVPAGKTMLVPVKGSTDSAALSYTVQSSSPAVLAEVVSGLTFIQLDVTIGGVAQQPMVFALFGSMVPHTVAEITGLVEDGFYNGTTFYRVIADQGGAVQLVQAGDPTNTGSGGPGYSLPFETSPQTFSGSVLAMAKPNAAGEPNNGSQFFITLGDQPTYDGKYTVFGKVLSGSDVLSKLTPRQRALRKQFLEALSGWIQELTAEIQRDSGAA